jgi:hypothetical protein
LEVLDYRLPIYKVKGTYVCQMRVPWTACQEQGLIPSEENASTFLVFFCF